MDMRKSLNTMGLCIEKLIIIQGKDRMKSIKDYYNKTCSIQPHSLAIWKCGIWIRYNRLFPFNIAIH